MQQASDILRRVDCGDFNDSTDTLYAELARALGIDTHPCVERWKIIVQGIAGTERRNGVIWGEIIANAMRPTGMPKLRCGGLLCNVVEETREIGGNITAVVVRYSIDAGIIWERAIAVRHGNRWITSGHSAVSAMLAEIYPEVGLRRPLDA